jgi:hypothetical protein
MRLIEFNPSNPKSCSRSYRDRERYERTLGQIAEVAESRVLHGLTARLLARAGYFSPVADMNSAYLPVTRWHCH